MSFSQVISAVYTDLAAYLVAGSFTALIGGAIFVGPEYLAQSDVYPRIVVVPKGASLKRERNAFNSNLTVSPYTRSAAQTQRPIATALTHSDAHVWGATYDAAELLRDQLIGSFQRVLPGAFELGEGTWTDTTRLAVAGREFVFVFSVHIPILDSAYLRAPQDTKPVATGTMQFPNGNVTGTLCTS
jgi:hypothetical protein